MGWSVRGHRLIKGFEKVNFNQYGFEIVTFGKQHDFAARNVTAKVGQIEVFDQALNSNYACFRVIEGFDKEQVRQTVQKVHWVQEDFLTCSVMNFWDRGVFMNALLRSV